MEYRTIAELFGLGRSTVGEIVLDTCEVIASHLMPRYVRVPQNDALRDVVDGFERRWGFPQTVGAIDGSHIPILKPQESASDYKGTSTPAMFCDQLGNRVPLLPFIKKDEFTNTRASCTFPGHPLLTSINTPRNSATACMITE